MPTTYPRTPRDHGRTSPACPARYHGTASAYTGASCRCPEAREAVRLYRKRLRLRGITTSADSLGAARRLQALSAVGWRWQDIAVLLDVSWQSAHYIAVRRRQRIHLDTLRRVEAVYQLLATRPGPSNRTRLRAAAKGWPPPAAWDDDTIDDPTAVPDVGGAGTDIVDEVAIRRALAGGMEFERLNRAEKASLFRDHAGRYGRAELARALGVCDDTVLRWRKRVAA